MSLKRAQTSKSITIRIASVADAETLANLGAATFVESFGKLYQEKDLSAFLEESHSRKIYEKLLADEAYRIWIGETDDGAAVGYAVAGPCGLPVPEAPDNAGELTRLYVLKGYQAGGLGSRLLAQALEFLDDRFAAIFVSVYSDNVGAQRLYRRFGFEKLAEYIYMVGDHPDLEWIMLREC